MTPINGNLAKKLKRGDVILYTQTPKLDLGEFIIYVVTEVEYTSKLTQYRLIEGYRYKDETFNTISNVSASDYLFTPIEGRKSYFLGNCREWLKDD